MEEKKEDFFEGGKEEVQKEKKLSLPVSQSVKVTKDKKAKKPIVLKNTKGQIVPQTDYFYSSKSEDTAPVYFNDVCGDPVDREDLIEVFSKIFKPEDNFLFYKTRDKEVYVVIVPLKFSDIVGFENDSVEGDFQKHAISFITEGSVNLDTLRMKLLRVQATIKPVNK